MRTLIATSLAGLLLGALASNLYAGGAQGPPSPGSRTTAKTAGKSCTWSPIGEEGCSVTLKMSVVPKTESEREKYCVQLFVDCPAGIPAGDPAESCNGPLDCSVNGSDGANQKQKVTCDGQDFEVGPKANETWDKVFEDCGKADTKLAPTGA